MRFELKNTLEQNINLTRIDTAGNLVVNDIVIIKRLPKDEIIEHLGYFHQMSRDLRLPYNRVLEQYKQHHKKLVG